MGEALDDVAVERRARVRERVFPVFARRDELADHGVVVNRYLRAVLDAAVNAHGRGLARRRPARAEVEVARARRVAVRREHADVRQEVLRRVLGVDARLDGPAVDGHEAGVGPGAQEPVRQPLAVRDEQHELD